MPDKNIESRDILRPFHLAFPVDDLAAARHFYSDILGCSEGRSSDHWIDFNFFGHQIVAHLVQQTSSPVAANAVDEKAVPVPHFGILLSPTDWQKLANRLRVANAQFIIEPYTRFKDEVGEQLTMFLRDPAGNALEFKAFGDDTQIFAQ